MSEPCRESDGVTGGRANPGAEQRRLEPMLGQVLAYGGDHADQFGGYGLVRNEMR